MSDDTTLAEKIEATSSTTSSKGGTVSEDTDTMDSMVQAASVPSLATLFQRGKDAGLLKPTTGYGGEG